MGNRYTHRRALFQFGSLLILSLGLLGILTRVPQIQTWLSQASGEEAALVVDTQGVVETHATPWRALAQGGETAAFSLTPLAEMMPALKPEYIRLDHVFDFYTKVTKTATGEIQVGWEKLDLLLGEMASAGATPMIVLSYLPPTLTDQGDITSLPQAWPDWESLVRQTVEHVSGPAGLNLANVYYEVWNEPDLFGHFKTYGEKNYLTLYEHTVTGALAAKNVQPFKIGGPGTTALWDDWVTRLMDRVVEKQLRLDFYSWHVYHRSPDALAETYRQFDRLMRRYPNYVFKVEPVITEWGFTSELHPGYDTPLAAAHTVAALSLIPPQLTKTFVFELQDGDSPSGQSLWGRWGLVTSPQAGGQPKPRYQALTYLNRLGEQRLSVSGQGSWVKAMAGKTAEGKIRAVVANYDAEDRHTETVPVTFARLTPGTYTLTQEYLGRPATTSTVTVPTDMYQFSLPLPPNTVFYLELSPLPQD